MNRLSMLPENQLADILTSLDRNIRDLKTSQVMASSGLVFYESASSAIGTLTKWLMWLVDNSRRLVCRLLLRRQQKRIKHSCWPI